VGEAAAGEVGELGREAARGAPGRRLRPGAAAVPV